VFIRPAVAGDRLFIGSCSGQFYCLDKSTGEVRWTYDTSVDAEQAQFHGNAILDEKTVIVPMDTPHGSDGYLYAFDQESGKVRWKRPLSRGVASDVLGRDDRIFVVSVQSEAFCLNRESGEIIWRYETIKGSEGPGAEGVLLLDNAFIFTAEREVIAVDVESGKELWHSALKSWVNTGIITHHEKLYVGDIGGGLHRLSPKDGSVEASFATGGMLYGSLTSSTSGVLALWVKGYGTDAGEHTFACIDSTLQRVHWRRDSEHEWTTYRPLLGEQSVVVGNESGEMVELQTADGSELWSTYIKGTPRGLSFVGDGMIIGTLGGTVYALKR
jgi:outer membrane protein assembly factor BamB